MDDVAANSSDEAAPQSATAEAAFESAAEREARYLRAIDQVTAISREAALAEAPTKYSLLELMIVVTLLAVTLGLVRSLGIWGGLIGFVGSLAWTNLIYPRWRPTDRIGQAAVFDATWGMLMPLVCLACDPILFKDQPQQLAGQFDLVRMANFNSPGFRAEGLGFYCVTVWQMLLLLLWLVARPWLRFAAGYWLGSFSAGLMVAAVMALLFAVPATVGLMVGVGLLGFTPMFTTYALTRRLREALAIGIEEESVNMNTYFWLLAALGFMSAWIVPLQIASHLRVLFNL
jgi:hypothetical protein